MSIRGSKLAIAALSLASAGAWAVEYADVVSSTPVVAPVPVAQRQCFDEPVVYQRPNSGAGALIGAIAGAAIGNGLGSGAGRAAATGLGMVAGAAIGDQVEANGAEPRSSTVQRCSNVTRYENRTVGYDVVYEYQGVRRSARLAQDPGAQVAVDVSVAPIGAVSPGRVGAAAPQAPMYMTPGDVVYEQAPARVIYAPPPAYYFPAPYLYIGGSYGGYGEYGGYGGRRGWGGRGHRH